ncbi:MAG: hypothetical protein HKN76_21105 [Saprospiraceae bacterium]|nr:hypothetical protein [Saprospiraceae bacterium]
MIWGQSQCPSSESPLNITFPTSIVGNGTPSSCTQLALQSALNSGGEIICNCGTNPVTIEISTPLYVSQNTVFDGGNLVTLNGNNQSRIIDKSQNIDFTIQQTTLINGLAPGPSGHFTNQCGGAILSRGGGVLKVINCHFENNSVTSTNGSDIAGGAVYVFGEQQGIFSGCTFIGNTASNGGAIGGLGSDIIIANCKFYRNAALGTSGGLRGHGGAINLDGVEIAAANKIYSVCGSEFIENHAEVQGGASNTVFSDNVGAKLEIDQCYYEGNYLRASNAGNGGAIFHVVDDLAGGVTEMQFSVTRSTFYANYCDRHGGGIWALINGLGVIENCTFYRDSTINTSHGLGGGLALLAQTANQGNWTVRNCTFARNYAGLFGGGVFSNPAAPTTWQNNILLNNYHSNSNPWVGLNVNRQMNVQVGTNIQWPQYRPNNSEDTKATAASIFTAAGISDQLLFQGGPTPTLALNGAGMAMGTGTGCPTTDQCLAVRSTNCDLGAFEYGATPYPTQVSVAGWQLGHKHYMATNSIQSDAILISGAYLTFDSAGEADLLPGFEVEPGSQLEVR